MRRMTQKEFEERVRETWGDEYSVMSEYTTGH